MKKKQRDFCWLNILLMASVVLAILCFLKYDRQNISSVKRSLHPSYSSHLSQPNKLLQSTKSQSDSTQWSKTFSLLQKQLEEVPKTILSSIGFLHSPFLDLESNSSKIIPVVVLSKTTNIEVRDAIRRTWAVRQSYGNSTMKIKVFFFVGIDEFMMRRVRAEQFIFDDVIQVSIPDTDSFSAYKELSAMLWVKTYLPNAPFYIKTEDNVIFNMKAIIDNLLPTIEPLVQESIIIGWFGAVYTVQRGTYQKFINATLTSIQFDSYYAMSLFYIVTSKATDRMLNAISHHDLIEQPGDPFVTGILREAARVQMKNLGSSPKEFSYDLAVKSCKEAFGNNSKSLFCKTPSQDSISRLIPQYFEVWRMFNNGSTIVT